MAHLIQVRPNVSDGLWLGFILPLGIACSVIKHNVALSDIYRCSFFLTLGILYVTIALIYHFVRQKNVSLSHKHFIIPGFATGLMIFTILNKNVIFCCFTSLVSTVGFYKIYLFILRNFPLCFTVGEALFCAQGATLFIYSIIINLFKAVYIAPRTSLQIATLIIQVGLLSVSLICFLVYKFKRLRQARNFYFLTGNVIIFVLLLPLHIFLRQSPLLWIYGLFTKDTSTLFILSYWVICCGLATVAVNLQIKKAKKASTSVRKIFHIFAVLVFLPGLLYECTIIYLASGVTLGLFMALELLRNINIPPLGASLQDGFIVFSDDKDIGSVALTPIYLLVGCALPLWLHPAPCDLTDSTGFSLLPLLSGLLSIGVGDTLASYVGSSLGKHKWKGSDKTIEGTLGCILGQLLVIYMLINFDIITLGPHDMVKIPIGIIAVSLVEAKTTQVDNLVLPLLMYIIFLF